MSEGDADFVGPPRPPFVGPPAPPAFVGPPAPPAPPAPPDTVLTLGDFTFKHPEVPENIFGGGDQTLVVHQLPGGSRVIDVMGRNDKAISWTGLFFGAEALKRAQYLDGLRIKGEVHTLSWSGYSYQVVISSFTWSFIHRWQISYEIECVVAKDTTGLVKSLDEPAALTEEGLLADKESLSDVVEEIGDDVLSDIMGTLDTAITAVSDFANATKKVINSVLTPIVMMQERITTLIAGVGNTIGSITTLGGLLPGNPLSEGAARLTSKAIGYTQIPRLYDARSYLGRIDMGVSALSGIGSGIKSVAAIGGDLYRQGGELYGDATKWLDIGESSGTSDPMLEGPVALVGPRKPRTEKQATGNVL